MEAIGPYQPLEALGRGALGAVFRARDGRSGREVALKLLLAADARTRTRLGRELEALRRLDHEHVVRVLDAGEDRGRPWLALELVRGRTLERRIESEGPLAVREAVQIAHCVALALDHAHRRGVLHRDVKPANVLLPDAAGAPVRLGDFGLARSTDPGGERMTATGALLGPPGFWAPEQACGARTTDVRTDVYGLGATLYAALTGRAPVEGETLVELLIATEQAAPRPPRALRPEVDDALDALVLRCLAKRPEDRPASAGAVARALAAWLAGRTRDQARTGARSLLVVASLVGGFALAGLGVLAIRERRHERAHPRAISRVESDDRQPDGGPAPVESLAADRQVDPEGDPVAAQGDELAAEAERCVAERNYPGAIEAATRALEVDPALARAWRSRALARAARGELETSLEDATEALRLEPEAASSWAALAVVRLSSRDFGAAGEHASRALELDPSEVSALRVRADARRLLGDLQGAWADLERLGALPGVRLDANDLLVRADLRRREGDLPGALSDTELALLIAPDSPAAFASRARTRRLMGELEGAIADASRALELDPRLEDAWLDRAHAHLGRGEYVAAADALTRVLERRPRDGRTWALRAGARRAVGALDAAEGDARRAVELEPTLSEGWYQLGAIAFARGDLDAADDYLSRQLAIGPDVDGLLFRGAVRARRGLYAAAVTDLTEALERDPARAELSRERARARRGMGELEAARADLARALELEPNDVWTLRELAEVLGGLGEEEAALPLLDRVIARDPTDPAGWLLRKRPVTPGWTGVRCCGRDRSGPRARWPMMSG